jgi:hypothetical protein
VYRLSPGKYDLPLDQRGYWVDAQTFVLEHDEIAKNEHFTFWMRFESDRVAVEGHSRKMYRAYI